MSVGEGYCQVAYLWSEQIASFYAQAKHEHRQNHLDQYPLSDHIISVRIKIR